MFIEMSEVLFNTTATRNIALNHIPSQGLSERHAYNQAGRGGDGHHARQRSCCQPAGKREARDDTFGFCPWACSRSWGRKHKTVVVLLFWWWFGHVIDNMGVYPSMSTVQ